MAIFDVGSLAYQTTSVATGFVSTIFSLARWHGPHLPEGRHHHRPGHRQHRLRRRHRGHPVLRCAGRPGSQLISRDRFHPVGDDLYRYVSGGRRARDRRVGGLTDGAHAGVGDDPHRRLHPPAPGTPHAFLYKRACLRSTWAGRGCGQRRGSRWHKRTRSASPLRGVRSGRSRVQHDLTGGDGDHRDLNVPGGHHPYHHDGDGVHCRDVDRDRVRYAAEEIAQVTQQRGSVFTDSAFQYAHGTATTFWQINAVPSLVKSSDVGAS